MYRTLLVWLSGFQMFVLFEVVINEPTFPLSHTLQATCGTLLFLWEQTPYSHQARRGTFLTSAIRPIPLSRTLLVGVRYIAFLLRTSSLSMRPSAAPINANSPLRRVCRRGLFVWRVLRETFRIFTTSYTLSANECAEYWRASQPQRNGRNGWACGNQARGWLLLAMNFVGNG